MSVEQSVRRLLREFEDLASIISRLRCGAAIDEVSINSPSTRVVLDLCQSGTPFFVAFYSAYGPRESELHTHLFGRSILTCLDAAAVLRADDGEHSIDIYFDDRQARPEMLRFPHSRLLLVVDFRSFTLTRIDSRGTILDVIASYSAQQLVEEIRFNGSLWDCLYPTHFALISRTLSCTFPRSHKTRAFFRGVSSKNSAIDERLALDQLKCLESLSTELLSLHQLSVQLGEQHVHKYLLSEATEGDYVIRRYSPSRSELLDFGTPAAPVKRGDSVTTYAVGSSEFHRDFVISPRSWCPDDESLRPACFDIIHMLAIRRAKLFRMGFGRRVYNVLLPPMTLVDVERADCGYVLFPCVNAYRTSMHGFRRTVSITYLGVPSTGVVPTSARAATLSELYRRKRDFLFQLGETRTPESLSRYAVSGPGRYYFGVPQTSSIPDLLRDATKSVFHRLLAGSNTDDEERQNLVETSAFIASQESKMVTLALQVDWRAPEGFAHPWERWLATGDDPVFRNSLFRVLFYGDYLDPSSSEASRDVVRFEELNIGNTMGADMGGMTLYNPQECLKVVLYPKGREEYPNFSIIRWMAWQVYIDSAIASMRALIYRFHPLLETRGNLYSLIQTLDEMIEEFVDFYDLAIQDYFYRREYERLRQLAQIDSDYAYLMAKFAASKDDESLREQRLVNKLVLSLMISTVTVTVVSTMAQLGKLGTSAFITVSLFASTILVWLGYAVFDPFRAGIRMLAAKTLQWWR